jgi:hypothetical protein
MWGGGVGGVRKTRIKAKREGTFYRQREDEKEEMRAGADWTEGEERERKGEREGRREREEGKEREREREREWYWERLRNRGADREVKYNDSERNVWSNNSKSFKKRSCHVDVVGCQIWGNQAAKGRWIHLHSNTQTVYLCKPV